MERELFEVRTFEIFGFCSDLISDTLKVLMFVNELMCIQYLKN